MISERLKAVIVNTLALSDFEFTDSTIAGHVPGWDPLSHVSVLAAVEAEYGVRLRGLEVIRLKTVGDLQTLIDRKTDGRDAH